MEQINPQYSTWPAEKQVLVDLLKKAPGKYGVEIGSFRGFTSLYLAKACQECNKQLICIDPWSNSQDFSDVSVYYDFLQNIEPVKGTIQVIRDMSGKAVYQLPQDFIGNCGFIFVDGDHSYEGTLDDLLTYYPLLMPGGTLALHDVFDSGWKGVGQALDEFIRQGMSVNYLKYIPTKQEQYDYQHGVSGLAWVHKSS